ncbi:hypothetical protein DY000_02040763 [Brassica cretica]|uniref:Uncharacterized protein n=1 Tax=Brassica cretica TaxID=69181 RepID=A0ABQ7B9G1_BRACR|nr:hypothetical protein DY000_02040763 [Brassica cretica]
MAICPGMKLEACSSGAGIRRIVEEEREYFRRHYTRSSSLTEDAGSIDGGDAYAYGRGAARSYSDPVPGSGELSDREIGESTLLLEPALLVIEGVEEADRLDIVNRFLIDNWRPQ